MLLKTMFAFLSLAILGQSAFAGGSAMRGCQDSSTLGSRYAFLIKTTEKKGVVSIYGKQPKQEAVLIGSTTVSNIETLQPWQRQAAAGGLVIVEGAAILWGSAAITIGAVGIAPLALMSNGTAIAYGASYLAPAVVLGLLKPFNPHSHYERANVEKCLQNQVAKMANGQEKFIILVMNDQDDFQDTLRDIKDIIARKANLR